jgi:hypothetical protein
VNFDHYFGPEKREYDFSGLTKPLCECVHTYAARTRDGRYEVLVVQDETSLGLDTVIYITSVARSALDAAVEVEGMIKAAKLLAGKP